MDSKKPRALFLALPCETRRVREKKRRKRKKKKRRAEVDNGKERKKKNSKTEKKKLNQARRTYRQQRLLLDLPRPPLPDLHALDLEEPGNHPVDRRGEAVVDQGDLRERDPEAPAGQRREAVDERKERRHFRRRDFYALSVLKLCERPNAERPGGQARRLSIPVRPFRSSLRCREGAKRREQKSRKRKTAPLFLNGC